MCQIKALGQRGGRGAETVQAAAHGRACAGVGVVLKAGTDGVHVGLMDGRFAPSVTTDPLVVQALCNVHVDMRLDCRLMTAGPG